MSKTSSWKALGDVPRVRQVNELVDLLRGDKTNIERALLQSKCINDAALYIRQRDDYVAPGFRCRVADIIAHCDTPKGIDVLTTLRAFGNKVMTIDDSGFVLLRVLTPHDVDWEKVFEKGQ